MNDFDKQVKDFSVLILSGLTALSPIVIIASMLLAFAWVGYMDYLYFYETLPVSGLAIMAGVFLQSMRFGTALGGVRMWKNGNIAGIVFLSASLLLTYLESAHVVSVAGILSDSPQAITANKWLIHVALWSSIGLEVLVAILFSQMYNGSKTEKRNEKKTKKRDVKDTSLFDLTSKQNGHATVTPNGAGNVESRSQIGYKQGSGTTRETGAQRKNAARTASWNEDELTAEEKKAKRNLRSYRSMLERYDSLIRNGATEEEAKEKMQRSRKSIVNAIERNEKVLA